MAGTLYINGVEMPAPAVDGLTEELNPIWSSDTGRNSSGKIVGTVVAVKRTVKIKWPALTSAQMSTILSNLSSASNPFFPVKYTDSTETTRTITAYSGPPSVTTHYWGGGRRLHDVSVEVIEQ